MPTRIGIVGMGYVGLTLAAALARKGFLVHGVDVQPAVLESLAAGRPHIFEPGVAEVFTEHIGRSIFVDRTLPAGGVDAAVICVSTPVDEQTRRPRLSHLVSAAEQVARCCSPETLVVVRSTVPVGTTRRVVLPALRRAWNRPRLVMAPERTIQGQALRELVELPQVVGGLDDESLRAGLDLFAGLASQLVPVSSLEAAELVKLSNNCHTDLIYAFGNELALIAERHGLDPLEVIRAANLDYPRPDLCKPGYVGGGCLSKDPYLMMNESGPQQRPHRRSADSSTLDSQNHTDETTQPPSQTHQAPSQTRQAPSQIHQATSLTGQAPFLIGQARRLNEYLPVHVAGTVVQALRQEFGDPAGARLAVLGWAYKGWPPTDDMRGTPITAMMPVFREAGLAVLGHDPMVTDEVIRRYGGEPVGIDKAFSDADAVLVINDHPDYRAIDVAGLLAGATRPRLVYDSWRILDEHAVRAAGVRYAGLGYLPTMDGAR